MMNTNEYGALIVRGRIISADSDGYRIQSFTCDGMTTLPLPAIGDAEYAEGDMVYYFMFPDGKGAILAAFE